MHQQIQEGPNESQAKSIAKKYGYKDWREIERFLDEHPFIPTEKGIEFFGYESISSKIASNDAANTIEQKSIFYVLGKVAVKVIGKGAGQLLSVTKTNEQEMPILKQNRVRACQDALINKVFSKPLEYKPSPFNSVEHSSIYDRYKFRFY
jgi:hypothetical protein